MKLSSICLSASIIAVGMAQRRPGKKRPKNKNKQKNQPTQPPLIDVPSQAEPGFDDNRQDIANMLAFRLAYYGYMNVDFTDVLR